MPAFSKLNMVDNKPEQELGESATGAGGIRSSVDRIPEIEGLRAILAWWVVADHCLGVAGYEKGKISFLASLVREGGFAVQVFIIISGFVIFHLLDQRQEGYRKFIIRRFFRLYPLFLVTGFVGVLLLPWVRQHYIAWAGFFSPESSLIEVQRIDSISLHLPWHILARIPMLHGVIPSRLLPFAPTAINDPSWSISLEWQFYLLAPLCLALVKLRKARWHLLLLLFTVAGALISKRSPEFIELGAFLPYHVQFFFLGCLSQRIYQSVASDDSLANVCKRYLLPIAPVMIALPPLFAGEHGRPFFPVLIWFGVFCTILARKVSANIPPMQFASRVLCAGWLQWLGKVSYSTYLLHMLVLFSSSFFLAAFAPGLTQTMYCFVLSLMTVGFTLLFSAITFHLIETPGIRLGSRIAALLSR